MASSLLTKLQLKAGQHLCVLNPPRGYVATLIADLAGITVRTESKGPADAVLLFVSTLADVEHLAPGAILAVKPDGLLWMAYPKGPSKVKTDVNRDILAAAVLPAGWRAVRQVALDETWSAMRFRPADKVGK
jgi:hypothetical protein